MSFLDLGDIFDGPPARRHHRRRPAPDFGALLAALGIGDAPAPRPLQHTSSLSGIGSLLDMAGSWEGPPVHGPFVGARPGLSGSHDAPLAYARSIGDPTRNAQALAATKTVGETRKPPLPVEGWKPSLLDIASLGLLAIPGGAEVRGAGLLAKLALGARGAKTAEEAGTALEAARGASAAARAGRAAGKVATFPLRHKKVLFGGPLAVEAPSAAINADPGQLKHALEGTGILASLSAKAGEAISGAVPGVAGAFLRDALQLPAQALPSVYLPAAAGLEAAKGDTSRGEKLLHDFGQTDAFAALAQGKFGEALHRAAEHPLFTGLEASGAYALGGRAAGIAGRSGALGAGIEDLANTERSPLEMYGVRSDGTPLHAAERNYSRNLFTSLLQHARERQVSQHGRLSERLAGTPREERHFDPQVATPREIERYLSGGLFEGARSMATGLVHRVVGEKEIMRRHNRDLAMEARSGMQGMPGVVAEIAQGSIRNEGTFHGDLASRRGELLDELRATGPEAASRREKASIRQSIDAIEKAQRIPEGDPRVGALFEEADAYGADIEPLMQKAIDLGLLDPEAARRARLYPFAMRHLGARHGRPNAVEERLSAIETSLGDRKLAPEQADALRTEKAALEAEHPEGLIGKDGEALDPGDIEAAAESAGARTHFLTHRPGWRGRGSFYQPFTSGRGRIPQRQRTGEAFSRGLYDDTNEALAEQHVALQTQVDRAQHFDEMLRELGVKKPNGDYFAGFDEAQAYARDPEGMGIKTGGLKMVPIRIAPMRAMARELDAARAGEHGQLEASNGLEGANPDALGAVDERMSARLDEALKEGTGKGDVMLIPETVVQQLREHGIGSRQVEKIFQSSTQAFKTTVLPLSDKWLLGNVFEVEMRSLMSGLGLGQRGTSFGLHKLADRYLAEFERQHGVRARRQLEAKIGTGQHFASRRSQELFRSDAHAFGRAFTRLKNTPGPGTLIRAYRKYADFIFRINGRMEETPQYAALGRQVKREIESRTGHWHHALRIGDEALAELVNGDINTARQIKYSKAVEDVFGRWGSNSPAARHFLTTYAPFYMWARSASRFIFLTLPTKHPVKTALLAAANQMTQKERQKFGLDLFTGDRLPGFLQGGIPIGGGLLPTHNYSSFGFFSDYPDALGQMILPQIMGGVTTLSGLSWRGDHLELPDGSQLNDAQRIALAVYTQAEATIPALSLVRRIREGGGTSEDTSTAWLPKTTEGTSEGTSLLGGLGRAFGLKTYDAATLDYLRMLARSRQINVPIDSAGGSSSGSPADLSSTIDSIDLGSGSDLSSVIDKIGAP